jgi:hypothetical protein
VLSKPTLAGQITIAWDASTGATGYKLYCGTAQGKYDIYNGKKMGNVTIYIINGLTPITQEYYIWVSAYNKYGESDLAGPVSGYAKQNYVDFYLAGINPNGYVSYTTDLWTWTGIKGSPKVFSKLVVGDFDGNGISDLAGITAGGKVYYTSDLLTWMNIQGPLNTKGNPKAFSQLVVGDFNGDGHFDCLAGITTSGEVYYTTDLSTWINIQGPLNAKGNPKAFSKLVVGDFNRDGHFDCLAGITPSGQVYYTTNLSTWTPILGTPKVFSKIVVGDFNNDSHFDDLAGITPSGKIHYTTNLQDWIRIPGTASQIVVGDFGGDSRSDLARITSSGSISYTTDLQQWTKIPGTASQIVVGDFGGDSRSDLAKINSSRSVSYTTNLHDWIKIPGVFSKLVY